MAYHSARIAGDLRKKLQIRSRTASRAGVLESETGPEGEQQTPRVNGTQGHEPQPEPLQRAVAGDLIVRHGATGSYHS